MDCPPRTDRIVCYSNPTARSAINVCQHRPFQPWWTIRLTRTGPSAVQETRAHRNAIFLSSSWNKLADCPPFKDFVHQNWETSLSKNFISWRTIHPTGPDHLPSFSGPPRNIKFLSLIFSGLSAPPGWTVLHYKSAHIFLISLPFFKRS
jgi:hypothetical protein